MGRKNNRRFKNHQKKPFQRMYNRRRLDDCSTEIVFSNKEKELIVKQSLREDQAGITEFLNRTEGFKGILKSRFSDFHVNEIDLTGEVLHLNDTTVPEEKEDLTIEEAEKKREELKNTIPEDIWKRIEELCMVKRDVSKGPADCAIVFDVSEFNKEQRTLVHRVIKKLYGRKLLSQTLKGGEDGSEDDGKRRIRVLRSKGHDRKEWNFPKQFVHFIVHKENMDTSEVASAIANKMNLKPSQVNFCGTKDKRAKTTQKFSVKKRTPRQIVGSVKYLNGVAIGNFSFKDKYLKLGDLHGNRFRIAIRNLVGEKSHIETLLNNVKEQGFINYFGLQRFGNCSSIPTYEVGIALLKTDYKLACELILKPRDNDVPFLKNIREMWWKNRDSKAAAALFRSERFIEKRLLDGLAQYGENDYAGALTKIPRNMLQLYPHAFQSLIFNQVASRRIKEFGFSIMPGDLVYRSRNESDETEHTELTEQEGDNDEQETEEATENVQENAEGPKSRFKGKVKQLTEDEVASGAYTIYDMVLTLPGYNIAYPDNIVGTWYKELMEKFDLSSEKLKQKMFSMKGAYRKMVVRPRDMSWEFRKYSTPDETLILSDLEILQGKTLEDFKTPGLEPKYEALLLDFCLPAASYATMLLRELLKCDTSSAAQSVLQQAAVKEHAATNEAEKEAQNVETLAEKRKANDSEQEEDIVKPAKCFKDNEEPASE